MATTLNCLQCGKDCKVPNYRIATFKFCSFVCRDDYLRGKPKKPSTGAYKVTHLPSGEIVLTHRYVMEKYLGRPLLRGEVIHHINEDPGDNRIENLMVMTPKEHAMHHNQKHPIVKVCQVCGAQYVPRATKREASKTCSRECRYALTSLTNRRPNSPHSMYRESAYQSEIRARRPRKSPKASSKPT